MASDDEAQGLLQHGDKLNTANPIGGEFVKTITAKKWTWAHGGDPNKPTSEWFLLSPDGTAVFDGRKQEYRWKQTNPFEVTLFFTDTEYAVIKCKKNLNSYQGLDVGGRRCYGCCYGCLFVKG